MNIQQWKHSRKTNFNSQLQNLFQSRCDIVSDLSIAHCLFYQIPRISDNITCRWGENSFKDTTTVIQTVWILITSVKTALFAETMPHGNWFAKVWHHLIPMCKGSSSQLRPYNYVTNGCNFSFCHSFNNTKSQLYRLKKETKYIISEVPHFEHYYTIITLLYASLTLQLLSFKLLTLS